MKGTRKKKGGIEVRGARFKAPSAILGHRNVPGNVQAAKGEGKAERGMRVNGPRSKGLVL